MTPVLGTGPELVPVSGFARGAFEPLADVFARTLALQGDGGGALAVRYRGEPVVDLVGGDYSTDSVQVLFSVTKVLTAIVAALLHEDGLLDLDAPISDVWPEFAKPSTAAITTRMVLAHRAGLPAVDRELSMEELLDGAEERELERQEPYWEPGTRHGYHAFTFGTLVDGVVRRATGRRVGDLVAERLAGPLGLDLWLGTPESVLPRLQPVGYLPARITPGRAAWVASSPIPPGSTGRLSRHIDVYNDPRLIAAGWPSSSGVSDARSLAALLAAVLEPGRLLSEDARRAMTRTQACGPDAVLGIPMHYGSGVQLPFPQLPFLGPRSFGHEGAGGSAVFADDEHDIAVGYTTNRYPPMMGAAGGFLALLPTLQHCLTAASTESTVTS